MADKQGMNPDQVRAKAAVIRAQLAVLDSVAETVERATLASLNPLSYGIQPGGLVIAPFAIGGTRLAAVKISAAKGSVLELAQKLFDEADQQAILSSASNSSYRGGYVPTVRDPSRRPKAPEFWEGLLGKTGAKIVALADLAVGIAGTIGEIGKAVGTLSKFGKAVMGGVSAAGKVFSSLAIAAGAYEATIGILEGDGFRAADGLIGMGIGVAGILLVANPVGAAIVGGVAIVWGVSKLLSGDVPVTKRIVDFAGWAGGAAKSAGSAVVKGAGNFVSGLTSPLRSVFG